MHVPPTLRLLDYSAKGVVFVIVVVVVVVIVVVVVVVSVVPAIFNHAALS